MSEEPGLPHDGPPPLLDEVLLTGAVHGADDVGMWRAFSSRLGRSRSDLAAQGWPRFLRNLAIECAVVAGVVAVIVLALWLLRR